MKNKISEMKRILEGFNTVDEVKNQISDIEDGVTEDTKSKQQQEKNPRR